MPDQDGDAMCEKQAPPAAGVGDGHVPSAFRVVAWISPMTDADTFCFPSDRFCSDWH
jgi:hypothetical protein